MISEQQQLVVECAVRRQSLVMVGEAGSGKSTVIRCMRDALEAKGLDVIVTGMTGNAANAIDGQTLHSAMGIPVQFGPTASSIIEHMQYNTTLDQAAKNKLFQECVCAAAKHALDLLCAHSDKQHRIRGIDVLIIDEVSMMSRFLFDVIDCMLRILMNVDLPFGGKQVIAVGDMLQLPPIRDRNACDDDMFSRPFFESTELFDSLFGDFENSVCVGKRVFVLTTNFRQLDPPFQELLQRVARGRPTSDDISFLKSRIVHDETTIPADVLRIFSRNADVDAYNSRMLADLMKNTSCDMRTYRREIRASPHGNPDKARIQTAVARVHVECGVPQTVELCKGAKVMLTSNVNSDLKLVNGTIGIIVGFTNDGKPMFVAQENYARYVAAEGCTPHELKRLTPHMSQIEKKYIATRVFEVSPVEKKTTVYGVADIIVTHMPLHLMWAITSHKAQGIQVPALVACLDSSSCFEPGMPYTVLSRATTPHGIYLLKDVDSAVLTRVSESAVAFYDEHTPAK